MKITQIAAVGVMTAALVGMSVSGAFAASATSTQSASASTCFPSGHDDAWPTWTDGNPGRSPGVAVWHDATGWHVRVTHNTLHDRVFSGEIRTTGALVGVKGVRLEQHDVLKVGSAGHSIAFRFNNYGRIDGFDFTTHCAPYLEFGFVADGHVVPTKRISIGVSGHHPAHDPFVIRRTA